MTDDGLAALSTLDLACLNLNGVSVSDGGCKFFMGMTRLSTLGLSRTRITNALFPALVAPFLQVTYNIYPLTTEYWWLVDDPET